jgi:methionine-rich copper-binding protein CopC
MTNMNPSPQAQNIPVNDSVILSFNHQVTPGANYGAISVKDSSGNPVALSKTTMGYMLVLTPAQPLSPGTTYTVTVPPGGVTNLLYGVPYGTTYTAQFTTASRGVTYPKATTPLTLTNVWPSANQSGLSITTKVMVQAGENIQPGTNLRGISLADSTGTAVTVTTSIINNKLVIAPVNVLSYNTTYTVTVPVGAVVGVDGAQLTQAQTAHFGTGRVLVPTNLDVYDVGGMPVTNYSIYLDFSGLLAPSASYAGITLKDASNVSTPLAVQVLGGGEGNKLVITPLNQLRYNTSYTLALPQTSVTDAYGSPLDKSYSIQFTTEAPLTFTTNPPNNATNVPITQIITLTMSNTVLPGPNFQQITVKDADGRPVNVTTTIFGYWFVVLDPVNNLNHNTTYTVSVPQGALIDPHGSVNDGYTTQFTT